MQKYPGFADRIHEGLVDIFGEKGRNIVTYHAEDGSGIGSAIVAGAFPLTCFPLTRTDAWAPAMTKLRKEANLYPNL